MGWPEGHLYHFCHGFAFATERHLIDYLLLAHEVLHLKLRPDWEEGEQHFHSSSFSSSVMRNRILVYITMFLHLMIHERAITLSLHI